MKISPKEVRMDIPANSLFAQEPQNTMGNRMFHSGNSSITFPNAVFNVNTLGSPDDYGTGGMVEQTIMGAMGSPEQIANPFGNAQ